MGERTLEDEPNGSHANGSLLIDGVFTSVPLEILFGILKGSNNASSLLTILLLFTTLSPEETGVDFKFLAGFAGLNGF